MTNQGTFLLRCVYQLDPRSTLFDCVQAKVPQTLILARTRIFCIKESSQVGHGLKTLAGDMNAQNDKGG